MRRVLWRWRKVEIQAYPAMLYLGLVFGVVAGNYAANLTGLDSARVFVATLILIVPALIGARLLYVASNWENYRLEPSLIWRRSEGGAAMYGGLLLSVMVSVPLLKLLQLSFGAFWDLATFTILIGMIFARVGCLLNGCCSGRPTDGRFALFLPDHRGIWKRRIPTQILEAMWAFLILLGAIGLWDRLPFPGALFLYGLAGYGMGRIVLEFTRNEQGSAGKLTIHQGISLLLVAISITVFTATWLG